MTAALRGCRAPQTRFSERTMSKLNTERPSGPALALHVPEPMARRRADFSSIRVSSAILGAQT